MQMARDPLMPAHGPTHACMHMLRDTLMSAQGPHHEHEAIHVRACMVCDSGLPHYEAIPYVCMHDV